MTYEHFYGPKPCNTPLPWAFDPSICSACGATLDAHSQQIPPATDPKYKPYEDAVWDWIITNGGRVSTYGGFTYDTEPDREHLKQCGIDKDRSTFPLMGSFSQFCGTFTNNEDVEGVTCIPVCNCGEVDQYDHPKWGILRITIGEMMFQVIKAGEIK